MIRYTLGGYDNVHLKSGYTLHRTVYGLGISITDADELNELLESIPLGPREPLVATYDGDNFGWEVTKLNQTEGERTWVIIRKTKAS